MVLHRSARKDKIKLEGQRVETCSARRCEPAVTGSTARPLPEELDDTAKKVPTIQLATLLWKIAARLSGTIATTDPRYSGSGCRRPHLCPFGNGQSRRTVEIDRQGPLPREDLTAYEILLAGYRKEC